MWLSRSVYNQVKGKLDLAFAPAGLHQVKNISEAVETFRVAIDGVAPADAPPPRRRRAARALWTPDARGGRRGRRSWSPAGAWRFWPGEPPRKERPAIAVLPFDN